MIFKNVKIQNLMALLFFMITKIYKIKIVNLQALKMNEKSNASYRLK
jgi:hypothetical protein